jgi:Zn-dependent protease with chaperone function
MALFLSLLGVFLATAVALGLFARGLAEWTPARLSRRTSAVGLVAPVLIAAGVCAALVIPGWWRATCHCVEHGLHHLHLCLRHPHYAGPALLPAVVVVTLWSALALPGLGRLALDVVRTGIWARAIASNNARTLDGVSFYVVDAPGLGACTAGLLRPRIAVDRQLAAVLDTEQLRAVVHHESAHGRRLDPLTLVILRACAAISLLAEESALLKSWQGHAEAECDRHAAARLGAPEPVAAALLALERLRSVGTLGIRAAAMGGNLAVRVRALLDPRWSPAPANLKNDLAHALPVALLLTLLLVLPGADSLHHGAETLLSHLLHP